MKFKSLLLVVGFIPALAMAEIAKPAPEKAPAVVARPAVVTHVYHHHYHYGKMPWMIQPGMMPPHAIHHYYQSGPPQISGKPAMEGGAREEMMLPGMPPPYMSPQVQQYLKSLPPPPPPIPGEPYGPNQNAQGYCGNAGNPC